MRISAFLASAAALLLCTMNSFATSPSPSNVLNLAEVEAQKEAAANTTPLPDPIYVDVGGDTIGSATVIPSLPYSDTGNTCGYASNYESCVGCFDCPFSATGGRDVVYKYVASADVQVNVDLCESAYDTKVYVVDGVVTNVVGCSDDECGTTPPIGWKSLAHAVQLVAGHTYYIIVDGYSSQDCGGYVLSITESNPCALSCPPGSIAENEPPCHDGYVDTYNGGCESDPVVFVDWPCASYLDRTVCGTYGGFNFNGLSYRDTDWYQLNLTAQTAIELCVVGEYSTLCGVIDGRDGCAATGFYDYVSGACATPLCLTEALPAGTWWIWIGTLGFGPAAGTCGGHYSATLSGYWCGPDSVEPATWGRIKGIYR